MNNLSSNLYQLDAELFDLVRRIDILQAVSPLNYKEQREQFFASHYSKNPVFVYRSHDVNGFELRRKLYNLNIEQVEDEELRQLYIDIISSYVDKIDQFKSIGTTDFLYDSFRYYGEPSEKDIRNSRFILHLPEDKQESKTENLGVESVKELMCDFAHQQGYEFRLTIDDSMIANALVSGTELKINGTISISEVEARALAHHELGVHLVTTLNARRQPLKIMSLGCPVNTRTQEGLAILSEYLAGCLTINRLKILALRVLAVESMIKEKNFRTTFLLLNEQYRLPEEQAFTITARVYRGGGFTKDYLYLQGFHQMLNAYENCKDFNNLLIGKTSFDYLPLLSSLVNKGILLPPDKLTPAFQAPVTNDPINNFIAHALR